MPNPLDMVTQDDSDETQLSPFDAAKMRGISIRPTAGADVASAGNDPLIRMVAPEPPTDIMAIIQQVKDRLLGTGGQERYQTWPERMVRSGLTLPGDVMSGAEPIVDPTTGRTSERVIERAQDVAGLVGGSALAERPGAGTLGSGALRPGAKAMPVEPAPVFYSALEHAATNAAQETMSPQQWLGYLKNQPGVKQEELQWTGIGDWLGQQKGKVKKEDVQQYLDGHKVEIKDVTKTDHEGRWTQEDSARLDDLEQRRNHLTGTEEAEFQRLVDRENSESEPGGTPEITKYSSYQLPGGENYREHLLTLPQSGKSSKGRTVGQIDKELDALGGPGADRLKYNALIKERDEALTGGDKTYRSGHWDEPNVLAHVRTNDRVMGATPIADIEAKVAKAYSDTKPEHMASGMVPRAVREGVLTPQEAADWSRARGFITGYKKGEGFEGQPGTGKKSLHIEEIQSDWHQQGRKQGYSNPERAEKAKAIMAEMKGHRLGSLEYERLSTELDRLENNPQGVPDAPFKTTWPELALKRMIRHAAENGYDRISWTPGEAQAARYDLGKQVNAIHATKRSDGSYDLLMRPVDRMSMNPQYIEAGKAVPVEKLADHVGKELAERIANQKEGTKEYSGVDLKAGGEGMREFYDKMLPKMADKIGKAHGVKVRTTEPGVKPVVKQFGDKWGIDKGDGKPHEGWLFDDKKLATSELRLLKNEGDVGQMPAVHYFDIPSSLRDHAIGKGFPLYMSGVPFPLTPVDHDPFKKERK